MQECDGVSYSHVAFYTDEDEMVTNVASNPQQKRVIGDGAAGAGGGCRCADHLHTDCVVGEVVRGVRGFAAALEQDKDGEREEE